MDEIEVDAISTNLADLWARLAGLEAGIIVPGALVLICLLIVWRLLRLRGGGSSDASLSKFTRSSRIFGYAVALAFFGGLGAWAAVAPLASAALAPGIVSPDGSRKTIQHLEGGIIRTIHVQEGDTVEAGDPIVTLEDTRALARFEELHEREMFLRAAEARLAAEQLNRAEITFPEELATSTEARVISAMNSQRELFASRVETQTARERILNQRVAQLNEEIDGLIEVIAAQDEQLALIGREIEGAQQLYDKGLERLPRLLALQREQADIRAKRAANKASIASNQQRIGETELQLHATRQQIQEGASTELAEIRGELALIRSQLPERADALARTQIVAPIGGRVMNVQVTTEAGGVVNPGAPILDIVPDEAKLIIDARVAPQDIETVHPGLKARVILTAFNQRFLPQIHGVVRSISADRFTDERSGEPYFLAKIEVDADDLEKVSETVSLVAGMPAEVMILTGERTFTDFLLKPLADSVRRSFRES
jgi:HlyD family secretion protein